jgi:hypothetical protein
MREISWLKNLSFCLGVTVDLYVVLRARPVPAGGNASIAMELFEVAPKDNLLETLFSKFADMAHFRWSLVTRVSSLKLLV